MAALSIATDLGMGQPLEFAMQSCVVAVRFGEKLGFDEQELRAIYYQSLLRYIGCNIETRLLAAVFGDELTLRTNLIHTDTTSADFFRQTVQAIQAANGSASSIHLLRSIATGMMDAARFSKEFYAGHCEIAERLAERLGFEKNIVTAIKQVYARWDGKGIPAIKAESIAPSMLVVSLVQDAVYTFQLGGLESAIHMAQQRKGSMYAPDQVESFCRHAAELLSIPEMTWETVLKLEPGQQKFLSETEFDSACGAIADFADVKSPYLLGHSTGVALIAEAAARHSGLPESELVRLRRAALLHDIGRIGVSAGIWGKQSPLTERDWEKIRLHPYHTGRVLASSATLAELGQLASTHHERLDGSGYYRGIKAAMLAPSARILAAADVCQALTEPRPHRPAQPVDKAAETLLGEVRAGRLDHEAVNSVLTALGHRSSIRKHFSGGLSERELEVLRLIARGHSIKEIAQMLTIAPKTADSHIQHIYNKIGVSTRAGATFFAMENNLL
jgi:HD-GYP domain-containing protein (c-di-GMP phosphodiesterase class II)